MRTAVALALGLACVVGRADTEPKPALAAIAKALQRLEAGITHYPEHRNCFSCHHHAVPLMALTAARKRGFEVAAKVIKDATTFSLNTFRNRDQIARGQGVGGDSYSVLYMLHLLDAVEHPRDRTTAALVEYLLVKQRKDGAWPIPAGGDRPPTMGSLFTPTGMAMAALQRHRPAAAAPGAQALNERIDAALDRGRWWLLTNQPRSTEDRVFHLRGLVDGDIDGSASAAAAAALLAEQKPDGSWPQLPNLAGDAYATATALVALRKAGTSATGAAYQKGVRYLLETQRPDGAWVVTTRTRPLQVYFDNGDAGGKSQFISFQATSWAVLALLETLGE